MAKPGAVLLLLALAYCCLLAQAFVPAVPTTASRARRFSTAALEAVKDAKSPEEFDKVRPSVRQVNNAVVLRGMGMGEGG